MPDLSFDASTFWITLFTFILIICCFYFTLTFFQHLRNGEEREIKQSKQAAVICFALMLLLPIFYTLIVSR
ncbi:hypothetical protein SAMN05443252_106302 [Bacillus sp. OV322]|nr:hypothetical protein SAMN05443252_106302 [Bacillus sp. OV322]